MVEILDLGNISTQLEAVDKCGIWWLCSFAENRWNFQAMSCHSSPGTMFSLHSSLPKWCQFFTWSTWPTCCAKLHPGSNWIPHGDKNLYLENHLSSALLVPPVDYRFNFATVFLAQLENGDSRCRRSKSGTSDIILFIALIPICLIFVFVDKKYCIYVRKRVPPIKCLQSLGGFKPATVTTKHLDVVRLVTPIRLGLFQNPNGTLISHSTDVF